MAESMRELAATFYYREHLGFQTPLWQSNPEEAAALVDALVGAAAGDGTLSDGEREWITGYFGVQGYDPELVASIRDAIPMPLDEVVALTEAGALMFAGPSLLYDAIRAASADGEYHAEEKAAITALAEALDLADELAEIEALVAEEEALKARRIALLYPDGHPSLLDRYKD